jgi:drug/metabolite transporter (DMT)-like permease
LNLRLCPAKAGWLGLEEHLTALQIVGVVLVLGGVMLVTIRPSR